MEIIINLAFFALYFVLKALVITLVVSLGSRVLQKSSHFWTMFRVSCVMLLIVNLIVVPLLDGFSE